MNQAHSDTYYVVAYITTPKMRIRLQEQQNQLTCNLDKYLSV